MPKRLWELSLDGCQMGEMVVQKIQFIEFEYQGNCNILKPKVSNLK